MKYKELQNFYQSLVFECLGSGDVERFRRGLADVIENLKYLSIMNSGAEDLPEREEVIGYDRQRLIDLNCLLIDYFPSLKSARL